MTVNQTFWPICKNSELENKTLAEKSISWREKNCSILRFFFQKEISLAEVVVAQINGEVPFLVLLSQGATKRTSFASWVTM